MSNDPAAYKETWNRLAATAESAMMHVAGYTDETLLKANTEITLKWLSQTIGIQPTDTFLEIGCGVGRVGRELAPLVTHWIGTDVSEEMLRHAADRLRGTPNITLVPTNGFDLSQIPDASVDAVYCTVVFMHLVEWDRWRYVQEAHRVLKPGGRFFCDNANIDSDAGWDLFLASAAVPPSERPPHLSRCSSEPELRTYLRRAGFNKIRTHLGGVWVVARGEK